MSETTTAPLETTSRESFSGPAEVLAAAHNAATGKYGDRMGSWSRWVVEAVSEKIARENPELFKAIKHLLGTTAINTQAEFLIKLQAEMADQPELQGKVEKFVRAQVRASRRKAA